MFLYFFCHGVAEPPSIGGSATLDRPRGVAQGAAKRGSFFKKKNIIFKDVGDLTIMWVLTCRKGHVLCCVPSGAK
jgi:hypothetical protein